MKLSLFALVLATLTFSCGKDSNDSAQCAERELECGDVRCIVINNYLDFRLVDNTSGADLLFGESPRYSISDVALYADAARTQPIALTSDPSAKLLKTAFAQGEMTLVIGGTASYKITADFKKLECCSNRVKNLSVDGRSVCVCCSDAVAIPVN